LDEKNGNTKYRDAEKLEMSQHAKYSTFKSLGKGSPGPDGYKKIRVHFVYDVKHNGCHKARLVAGGHLTDVPVDSVYSGVVLLQNLCICVFLAELNNLQVHAAGVGNGYLEAETKEKVYITGGPGFGDLEGHTLIIHKALYGLRSSGLNWHERFANTLRDMGFVPSKADTDIWMRRNSDLWEYIATYVDDLAIIMKDPKSFTDLPIDKYKYKLKGVGPITYRLGSNYKRDPDGTFYVSAESYIDKMIESYERTFGAKPKENSTPLVANDHPEMDNLELLGPTEITLFQSHIGSLQWCVTIGRFDIATAVMTMSRYRAAPRQGHLERTKRMIGYLRKYKTDAIRIYTGVPNYSSLGETPQYDWMSSVYGNVTEELPNDAPTSLGKEVTITTYVDANLYHDWTTGRAVTGTLDFLNGTPIDWFSKRQNTVETATYGYEFVAARNGPDH
jgi:hypothetical protein